jgi:hypothetical protein
MPIGVQVTTLKSREGAYRVAAVSGLTTGVAAASATAGHLFAVRWAPTTDKERQAFLVLQRLRARMFTIAGFTAAQETGIDLSILRSYSAPHTGGTAVVLTGNNQKKKAGLPTSVIPTANMQIATTGALTAGTHTFDAQPIAQGVYAELAAAATVAKGSSEIYLSTEDLDRFPVVLSANEGLCIRNTIAQGAAGTQRLVVEMDWLEVTRY